MKVSIYELLFSQYDRFNETEWYLLSMILSSLIFVFVINCLFTLPLYSFVSTICVAFIIAEILMLFPVDNTLFSMVSMVNVTMAIGFAVDYCSHMGQCFASHPHLAPKERALYAINTMAGSVIKAGLSTVLSVSMLICSQATIAKLLVKCFVIMVVSGLLHAIIFLPCMLYLLTVGGEHFFPSKETQLNKNDSREPKDDIGCEPSEAFARPLPILLESVPNSL